MSLFKQKQIEPCFASILDKELVKTKLYHIKQVLNRYGIAEDEQAHIVSDIATTLGAIPSNVEFYYNDKLSLVKTSNNTIKTIEAK